MSSQRGKVYQRRIDVPIGLLLAFGYFAILLSTADIGFCRDEGYYFHASRRYITWVEHAVRDVGLKVTGRRKGPIRAFSNREIRKYWAGFGNNHEHPPFAKLMMGGTWWVFAKKLRWVSNATGYRMAGMFWGALMILLVYLWGVRVFDRTVGLFAAFSLMLIPRFFFHSHLAAFDVPISALWLLVAYAFWRSLESQRWAILTGLFFGLALATKHNSWLLPAPLGLYWLCQIWNKLRFRFYPAQEAWQIRLPMVPSAIWWSLIFAPLCVLLLWPLLWPTDPFHVKGWLNTWKHLQFYAGFHLKHVHYDAYYFGTLHLKPPFPISFPFGMTAVTFPLVIVFLSLSGFWYLVRQQRIGSHMVWWSARLLNSVLSFFRRPSREEEQEPWEFRPRPVGPADKTGLYWLLNAAVPIAVIALPNSPIFGGTKHWMPAWPFLALMAGIGFARLWNHIVERYDLSWWEVSTQRLAAACFATFLLSSAVIGLVRSHPYGLAYYNTAIGGPRGSANWKMQRQFWGFTVRQALPWMNRSLTDHRGRKGRVRVDFHDTNYDSYKMYLSDKLMDRRIKYSHTRWRDWRARYMAFIHQKWLRTQLYNHLTVVGARAPVYGTYVDNVPLMTLWEKTNFDLSVWW